MWKTRKRDKKKVKWSRYRPGVARRVGRGIALLFHDRGTRRGWVVSRTPRPHFTPGKDPVPILQEAGWAPGPVWTGGKSRPHRDSIRTFQPVVSRYTDLATRRRGRNPAPNLPISSSSVKLEVEINGKDMHLHRWHCTFDATSGRDAAKEVYTYLSMCICTLCWRMWMKHC